MAMYGSDYDRWSRASGGDGRGRGTGYGWDEQWWDGREMGWSRPEFNVSLGAWGARTNPDWWDDRGFRAAAAAAERRPQEWRTGDARGGGSAPAITTTVRQIMTENPEAVTPDTPLAEVARRMRDLDVGIIPIVRDIETGILEGLITDRDIAVRAAADGKDMKKATAGDYMSRDVESVRESDTVRKVFSVMKRRRVRRVPVTDEAGRLVGIVAQADLAVDYAGLDLDRETEVEEVLERISEPARPRTFGRGMGRDWRGTPAWGYGGSAYDRDLRDRLRDRWQTLKHEARHYFGRGYDRPYF